MEFKEAMRIFNKICRDRELCDGCVLENKCIVHKDCDYAEAEAVLVKWAAEHPERTIADDFFEKHPKAPKDAFGKPHTCAISCGYRKECLYTDGVEECVKCWRRPLEEQDNDKT